MHGLQNREAEHSCGKNAYDLAHVRAKKELDSLADIIVNAPALFDGADDARKVVVGKHHVGNIFRDIRAGYAHAHADIGAFDAGRIIHAVAGHGGDIACAAPCVDYPRLVLGLNTGIDADISEACLELGVGHL